MALGVLFAGSKPAGAWLPLADASVFDWMARLASNARLHFVDNGLGMVDPPAPPVGVLELVLREPVDVDLGPRAVAVERVEVLDELDLVVARWVEPPTNPLSIELVPDRHRARRIHPQRHRGRSRLRGRPRARALRRPADAEPARAGPACAVEWCLVGLRVRATAAADDLLR